ncbi:MULTISPECIES: transcriptional regulator domain-containing protein [unclassified Cedecea]|uniref:transcriptional regulator domain-containing protein n=1 Tax=unclassified Cedecea TaxID=2649846 RepID=UPI003018D4AF
MYTDFAWEFLRRNDSYRECWNEMQLKVAQEKNSKAIVNNAAASWGLVNFVDPYTSSPLDVFWCPKISRRTLYAKVAECAEHDIYGTSKIDLGLINKSLEIKGIGVITKYYNENGYVQIITEDALSSNENFLFFSLNKSSLVNNLRLVSFLYGENCALTTKSMKNTQEYLSFYDLYNNGLTQREIAKIKFKDFFTDQSWECSDWLRARVRYKIKKATSYIRGQYLDLV